MKIVFPYNKAHGGFLKSMERACQALGFETLFCKKYSPSFFKKTAFGIKALYAGDSDSILKTIEYNADFVKQINLFKPDILINFSGSGLLPDTIKNIHDSLKCQTICLVADNPCDPLAKRDKYFAMSLRYYDILLLPEPIWGVIIRNIAPKARVLPFYGGYDVSHFFPIENRTISPQEFTRYSCDISLTGGSYGSSPEGAYRSGILGQLDEYNVKIWGDAGWKWRFPYYPNLRNAYQGDRLPYEDLRKLFTLSSINMNIPSPQIFTGFQPRVFEIAATNGFQIIDHSEELFNYYNKEEVVTFKSFFDLKRKIDYYLTHKDERIEIAQKMHLKTIQNYSWDVQIERLLKELTKML